MRPKMGVVVLTPMTTFPRLMISSTVCAVAGDVSVESARPTRSDSATSDTVHRRAGIDASLGNSGESVGLVTGHNRGDSRNRVNLALDSAAMAERSSAGPVDATTSLAAALTTLASGAVTLDDGLW